MSNQKSKNLTICAASSNYLPGLNALLNSIDHWKIDTDVILLAYHLPEEYLKRIKEVFDFNIRIIQAPEGEQTRMTAIERFRIAYTEGVNYEAILLLDADFFFMTNVGLYFKVASKGFIVASRNGMIINFNEEYQKRYQVNLGAKEYPYPNIHTTIPIWLSPQDLDWFKRLYHSRRVDGFDDFLYLNILGIVMGKDKKTICLEPYSVSNIHHFSLKPVTGIIKKGKLLLNGLEGEMISMHGKWWDKGYYDDLAKVMEHYLKVEKLGEKQKRGTLESRKIILEEFMKYTYLGKLDLREFVKIDWLEKKLSEIDPMIKK